MKPERIEIRLSSIEFGSATIVLLCQQQEAATSAQQDKIWGRLTTLLRAQIAVLRNRPEIRKARLVRIEKQYYPREHFYLTIWELQGNESSNI